MKALAVFRSLWAVVCPRQSFKSGIYCCLIFDLYSGGIRFESFLSIEYTITVIRDVLQHLQKNVILICMTLAWL